MYGDKKYLGGGDSRILTVILGGIFTSKIYHTMHFSVFISLFIFFKHKAILNVLTYKEL